MASGRFLSTTIADDERLCLLSLAAEFLFIKTIPHLDRDGMISGKPGLLYSRVCPAREELFGHVAALIDEWVKVGLVIRFESDFGPVLFFPGFAKNNKLQHYERERPSRFPLPPGYGRGQGGLIPLEQVLDEVLELVPDEVQDEVPDVVLESVRKNGTEVKVKVKEEVKEKEEGEGSPPPLEEQPLHEIVCEILGWDAMTISDHRQRQVAAAVNKLQAAGYTYDELECFDDDVWAYDWRWKKKQERPTLEEFMTEVGKLRLAAKARSRYSDPPPRRDGERIRYSQWNTTFTGGQ